MEGVGGRFRVGNDDRLMEFADRKCEEDNGREEK